MNVSALISHLQKCHPEAVVKVISVYDGSYAPVGAITVHPDFVVLDVSDQSCDHVTRMSHQMERGG